MFQIQQLKMGIKKLSHRPMFWRRCLIMMRYIVILGDRFQCIFQHPKTITNVVQHLQKLWAKMSKISFAEPKKAPHAPQESLRITPSEMPCWRMTNTCHSCSARFRPHGLWAKLLVMVTLWEKLTVTNIAVEHGPVEIVSLFRIQNGDFDIVMSVYQSFG